MNVYLDGILLPLKGLLVTATQELSGKDMSANSSSTDYAETGNKAKILKFSGHCKDNNSLKAIYDMSLKQKNGKRHVYRINQRTANTLKIRQVKFQGHIKTHGEKVMFEMVEFLSISERIENRLPDKKPYQQVFNGVETNIENNDETVNKIPPFVHIDLSIVSSVISKLKGLKL